MEIQGKFLTKDAHFFETKVRYTGCPKIEIRIPVDIVSFTKMSFFISAMH